MSNWGNAQQQVLSFLLWFHSFSVVLSFLLRFHPFSVVLSFLLWFHPFSVAYGSMQVINQWNPTSKVNYKLQLFFDWKALFHSVLGESQLFGRQISIASIKITATVVNCGEFFIILNRRLSNTIFTQIFTDDYFFVSDFATAFNSWLDCNLQH